MSTFTTSISDYSIDNIVNPFVLKQQKFEKKTTTGKNTISYFTFPIEYNHKNGKGPMIIRCSEPVTCDYGIKESQFQSEDGKPGRSSILINFTGNNSKFSNMSDDIQQIASESIYQNRNKLGAYGKKFMGSNDKSIITDSIKMSISPALRYRTTDDGERDETRPRFCYVKLNDYGNNATTFYTFNNQINKLEPFPKQNLFNRSIKIRPVILFREVYIGSNASIQVFLHSAIVVDINSGPVISPDLLEDAKASYDPEADARLEQFKTENPKESTSSTSDDTPDEVPDFAKIKDAFSGLKNVKDDDKDNDEVDKDDSESSKSDKTPEQQEEETKKTQPFRRFKRTA